MKSLKLLFKDKLTIIIAALLMLTLLACIPFVPSSAKYTTSSETTFDVRLSSGVPILRTGPTNYNAFSRLSFRRALGELMMKEVKGNTYENWGEALADVHAIDIIQAETPPADAGEVLSNGSHTVAESGTVAVQWDSDTQKITISSPVKIRASKDCQDLFKGRQDTVQGMLDYGLYNLQEINLKNLSTEGVTSISDMFAGTKIKTFSFDGLDTSSVTNMSNVFENCDRITTVGGPDCDIDISNLKVNKAQNLSFNFSGCDNLESVNLSVLPEKTASLTNIVNMFDGCTKLTTVVFGPNFSTEKVEKWQYMFRKCSSIKEITWGENVRVGTSATDMQSMFDGCTKLTNPNLSTLIDNTSNVQKFNSMFANCTSLTELDLSMFNTSSATALQQMFENCTSLKTINFGSNFTASAATDTSKMFKECQSLGTLNLSNFDFSKVTSYTQMFYFEKDTYSLTVIKPTDQTKWKTAFEAAAVTGKGKVTFQ